MPTVDITNNWQGIRGSLFEKAISDVCWLSIMKKKTLLAVKKIKEKKRRIGNFVGKNIFTQNTFRTTNDFNINLVTVKRIC